MKYEAVNLADIGYPPLLKEITNPPNKLFILGSFNDFTNKAVAIVGTRKATIDGVELARKIAKSLAEQGFVIVSGLAMGIDTAAHSGALDAGGKTIAVLGTGIDLIYPAQNQNLAKKILENGGAIISEYGPGTPGLPHQFLERNRIVAGLTIATIVIEAPKKSGAIVTARLAAESGREVFVFPGPAGHPQYAGSHALIRDGARFVSSLEDVLEDLSILPSMDFAVNLRSNINIKSVIKNNPQNENKTLKSNETKFTESQKRIYDFLRHAREAQAIDNIAREIKLTIQEINQIIGEFLIYGIVEEIESGYRLRQD